MKIKKTKTEKINQYVLKNFNDICEKLKKSDKVKIILDRKDFKKKLSTNFGFGFQDLKRKNRELTSLLISNFDIKIVPLNMADLTCEVIIKNK
jgi:predicted transglutaminase-like protease